MSEGETTRAKILGASTASYRSEAVEVPEWGMTVTIRELTARDADGYHASLVRINPNGTHNFDMSNHRSELLVRCLRDDSGARIFADGDAKKLGDQPSTLIDRLYGIAQKVTGIDNTDSVKQAKNA
jgi:hypothetical protein